MLAWRVSSEKWIADLTGRGAAIAGGRWNDQDVPAVYMGLTPAICCLESFVHASGVPLAPMKIACFELPDDQALYLNVAGKDLPEGWASLPADRASMDFGTRWLTGGTQLAMVVPSAVLPLEKNLVINPQHPAKTQIKLIEVYDFAYDQRMFK